MKLSGVNALVTGAASGMGRATSTALAAAGARVAMLDVNARALSELASTTGGSVLPCDLRDGERTDQVIRGALKDLGPVRVLICCAGIGRMEPIVGPGAVAFAQLEDTIRVNLLGTLRVVQLVAADIMQREPLPDGERAVIIMVASGAAFDGPMESAAYTASKGGIVSMTLALAREFGDSGIRVNTISPGAFDTPMIAAVPAELTRVVPAMTPFPKRMGRPTEFAELALHICANQFLNGAVIRLDGANRMPYFSTAALPQS